MDDATEHLRAMLDERGIEWKSETSCDTYWYGHDRTFYRFAEYSDGSTVFSTCQWNLTPKQVLTTSIAATVGAQDGTVDMDWVRNLVERHSDHIEGNGRAFHNGAYERMAEEISATVGVGTCKRIYHPNRITKKCTCSNCGCGASDERWAYCPKCGHKYVHGEVEERWKRVGRKVAE